MKLAVAVRVVALAVILLGAATTERFHHPEQPSRQPAASQPSMPSADEPHRDIFTGPPHERRQGLYASMTMTNGLPDDVWSESQRGAPPSAPDYAIILMALVAAATLSLMKTLARALLVVILVGLMLSATARADAGQTAPSCSYLHTARPDSAYAFTQASLIALSYAKSAGLEAEAFEAERKAESNPQTLLIAMMRHTKTVSESYACAEMVLEPYKKSTDQKMIAPTADWASRIYRQHIKLNDQFLDLLRNLPDLSNQPAKRADTISTIEVERGKLGNDLIKATTLTLLGLVDQSKTGKDGTLQTLVITRAERKELLDRLSRTFPKVKEQADKASTSDLMFMAGLYYQFLTKPYRSADE